MHTLIYTIIFSVSLLSLPIQSAAVWAKPGNPGCWRQRLATQTFGPPAVRRAWARGRPNHGPLTPPWGDPYD